MSKVSCDCIGCKQHRICNVCSHYCGGSHSESYAPVVVPEPTQDVVTEQQTVVTEQPEAVVPEPTQEVTAAAEAVVTEQPEAVVPEPTADVPVATEPAPEATQ
jgi:hypothetical protein